MSSRLLFRVIAIVNFFASFFFLVCFYLHVFVSFNIVVIISFVLLQLVVSFFFFLFIPFFVFSFLHLGFHLSFFLFL